ncbi:MAG: TIGR00153 family protein [Nitrospinota bacterium]|nr:TIGR00153 family protein [Nitrospinota bacterium]
MQSTILNLFGKSPFKPLQEHLEKVKECLEQIEPLFNSLYKQDFKELKAISKKIMKLEHQADKIKDKIRDNLPKNMFLAVDRRDLLNLLSAQDSVCDAVEDLAVVLNLREMTVPEKLKPLLTDLTKKVVMVGNQSASVILELNTLLEASFSGPEAEKVIKMVGEVSTMEWEADKIQYKLAQTMFKIEKELDPVSIFMWMKIFQTVSEIADASEKVTKLLRLFLSK